MKLHRIVLAVMAVCVLSMASFVMAGSTPSRAENLFGPNVTEISVTNGATLTLTNGGTYAISPILGTNGATCTVTLADPLDKGKVCILYIPAPQTNLLGIADSGNVLLSSAFAGGTNDTLILQAIATNLWVQTGRNDN